MNPEPTAPVFNDPLPIDLFLESTSNAYLYDDLRQFEHYLLDYLSEAGHDYDSPLGLWAESSDEMVFLIAACWRLGIPIAPFDPELSDDALAQRVQQVQVKTIVTERSNNLQDLSVNIIALDKFNLSEIIQPDFEPCSWVKERRQNVQPDRIFGYFFTSGTSGSPKTVPLKRRQMLFAAESSAGNLKPQRNRFWLLCMPLHHVGGVSLILRSVLYGSAVFRMNTFDSHKISNYLSDHRFQAASFVPTMLTRLLSNPDLRIHDNFQAILLGGGPIDKSLVKECFERGVPMIASYGMTESCAQIAANPLMTIGDLSRPQKSVGKLFSPNEIEIRDEENHLVKTGVSGQIWLKGPQIFDGYLHPDPNRSFDNNGWFNTGDFGYLNKNEELFIEARRTDLIISGGENISPMEVEEALRSLDAIREAAVIGIPDEEWGQKVVAVVVLQDGIVIHAKRIQEELRSSLRSFKIPKQVIKTDRLPRTATGKIQRNKIKDLYYKRLNRE